MVQKRKTFRKAGGCSRNKDTWGGMSELVNIKCTYFMDGSEQKNVIGFKKNPSTMENLLANMEEGSHKI